MDENLAWLTQKTEESKCNKVNFTRSPSPNTINAIELLSNKKVATPPFWPNFWYPSPLSDSIFERSYPPSLIGGGGGSNYATPSTDESLKYT